MSRPAPDTWSRFTLGALACAGGLALACGGKTATAPGADGGTVSSGSVSDSAACADYFDDVLAAPCDLPPSLPAAEITRLQGRFETVCEDGLALPGVMLTATTLEACIAAVKANGCDVLAETTGPCWFDTGTLATGATCVADNQCQQGVCTTGDESPDGGVITCGTCRALPAIGQSCAGGQSCGPNAYCGTGSGGANVCVAITYAGPGASCGGNVECAAPLSCGPSMTCEAPGGLGTPCSEDANCTSPLVCPAAPGGSSTCQSPGGAGSPCIDDAECTSGLRCDSATSQCATATWANAGQTCSGTARCLVGSCPFNDGTATVVCPTVIADGQPCDPSSTTATCDTFADCIGGTCLLGYASCP